MVGEVAVDPALNVRLLPLLDGTSAVVIDESGCDG
jgi:hypothetical protein